MQTVSKHRRVRRVPLGEGDALFGLPHIAKWQVRKSGKISEQGWPQLRQTDINSKQKESRDINVMRGAPRVMSMAGGGEGRLQLWTVLRQKQTLNRVIPGWENLGKPSQRNIYCFNGPRESAVPT